jgi:ribosomal protein S3
MGRKTPPAALRLGLNRHFDSYWFSDRLYGKLLHQTLAAKTYLHKIFRKIGTSTALSHVQATPNTVYITSFFASPRILNKKIRRKVVDYKKTASFARVFDPYCVANLSIDRNALFVIAIVTRTCRDAKSHGRFVKQWPLARKEGVFGVLLAHNYYLKQKRYVVSANNLHSALSVLERSVRTKDLPRKAIVNIKRVSKPNEVVGYSSHIESTLGRYFQKRVVFVPKKVWPLWSSATFVAHFVAIQLEKNKKKTFSSVFKDVIKQCTILNILAGLRVSVAGRLNGAEIARVESTHYGQVSLHVFKHKVDYCCTIARTRNGVFGVKVWISFKR